MERLGRSSHSANGIFSEHAALRRGRPGASLLHAMFQVPANRYAPKNWCGCTVGVLVAIFSKAASAQPTSVVRPVPGVTQVSAHRAARSCSPEELVFAIGGLRASLATASRGFHFQTAGR